MLMNRELIDPGIIFSHLILTLIWPVLIYRKILQALLTTTVLPMECCVQVTGTVHRPFATKNTFPTFKQLLLIYPQIELWYWTLPGSIQETLESSRRNVFHWEEIPLAQLHGVVCLGNSVPGDEPQGRAVLSISCVTLLSGRVIYLFVCLFFQTMLFNFKVWEFGILKNDTKVPRKQQDIILG